jgi:pimeloyl-ACP methyl ester carboxylesterase
MNDTAPDPRLEAPLAHLGGQRPEAPAWFRQALAAVPERGSITVDGARVETLTWGERGRPGVLFLHGNAAHADWWSFLAPFFSGTCRVAALSWSGMGGSDHREAYALDGFVREALAVAEQTGLFDGAEKPIFIGHSFGGFPIIAAAARHGTRLGGVITVDTPIFAPERRQRRSRREEPEIRPNRIYPSLEAALARFRLAPVQPCPNLFIADHIARAALKEVETGTGRGWTWRFDPLMWHGYKGEDPGPALSAAQCPLAMVLGAKSSLMDDDDMAYLRAVLPAGSPVVEIPEAHHHVMVDQPLALVAALRALMAGWWTDAASGEKMPANRGRT